MIRSERLFLSGSAWKHFRKNKTALISLRLLTFLLIIAVFAPLLSNEKPLFAEYNHEFFFPAFSFSKVIIITNADGKNELLPANQVDWKHLKLKKVIWPPVSYSPGKSDNTNPDYDSPSLKKHFLGTTKNGADVLSGLIHGARISLTIGILAMFIASLIGITLGSLAGYFGDHLLPVSRGCLWMSVAGIIPAFFYSIYIRSDELTEILISPGLATISQWLMSLMIFLFILFIFYHAGKLLSRISFFSKKIFIHVDSLVSRTIEVFVSIPRLILIISIAALARPSFFNLVLIIGFTSWTEIARFTRAELLRARNSEYIETAVALGLTDFRIIMKHALPNALAPATVAIVFGIASAILIESGLSFLGIGVPQEVVTWGSLLFAGKENFEAWWLVIFPGLAIFITVTAFNLVGDGLRDAMDVRSRVS